MNRFCSRFTILLVMSCSLLFQQQVLCGKKDPRPPKEGIFFEDTSHILTEQLETDLALTTITQPTTTETSLHSTHSFGSSDIPIPMGDQSSFPDRPRSLNLSGQAQESSSQTPSQKKEALEKQNSMHTSDPKDSSDKQADKQKKSSGIKSIFQTDDHLRKNRNDKIAQDNGNAIKKRLLEWEKVVKGAVDGHPIMQRTLEEGKKKYPNDPLINLAYREYKKQIEEKSKKARAPKLSTETTPPSAEQQKKTEEDSIKALPDQPKSDILSEEKVTAVTNSHKSETIVPSAGKTLPVTQEEKPKTSTDKSTTAVPVNSVQSGSIDRLTQMAEVADPEASRRLFGWPNTIHQETYLPLPPIPTLTPAPTPTPKTVPLESFQSDSINRLTQMAHFTDPEAQSRLLGNSVTSPLPAAAADRERRDRDLRDRMERNPPDADQVLALIGIGLATSSPVGAVVAGVGFVGYQFVTNPRFRAGVSNFLDWFHYQPPAPQPAPARWPQQQAQRQAPAPQRPQQPARPAVAQTQPQRTQTRPTPAQPRPVLTAQAPRSQSQPTKSVARPPAQPVTKSSSVNPPATAPRPVQSMPKPSTATEQQSPSAQAKVAVGTLGTGATTAASSQKRKRTDEHDEAQQKRPRKESEYEVQKSDERKRKDQSTPPGQPVAKRPYQPNGSSSSSSTLSNPSSSSSSTAVMPSSSSSSSSTTSTPQQSSSSSSTSLQKDDAADDNDDEWRHAQEAADAELAQRLQAEEDPELLEQIALAQQQEYKSLHQHFVHQAEEAEASDDVGREHLANDRLQALQETMHNPDLVIDFPAEFDQIVLDDSDYAEFFSQTRGTPLEQQLHMELRATVRASSDLLHRYEDDHQVQAITPIIHQYAAMAANTDNPQAAFCMADVCHGLTDLSSKLTDLCNESLAGKMGKAAAEGAMRSAENYVTYAFHNPQSIAIDLALGAVCPPAVAYRHLAILAHDVYQNRHELYGAAQQFITDINEERYRDDEWLEANVGNFTQFFCDMFVTQRVGRRIIAKSPVAPLARGFAKQKEIVHACAQRGLNAATQKVSSSIKTLLQEAGDAIKTRSLEPAFAGIERVEKAAEQASSQSKSLQPRRSERLMKKSEGGTEKSAGGSQVTTSKPQKTIMWTPHLHKHFPQKNMSWKDIVNYTKTGLAKYRPGVKIEELERTAWEKGTPTTNGKNWKVFTCDDIIGAKDGIETRHMRVEMNTNTIHGHPITPADFKRYTR